MENHDKRSKSQVRECEIANRWPRESLLNHGGILQRDRFPHWRVHRKKAQHLQFVWRQQNKLLTPDFLSTGSQDSGNWKTSSAVPSHFPFLGHSLGKDLKMSLIWTSYHTEDLFQAKKKKKRFWRTIYSVTEAREAPFILIPQERWQRKHRFSS